MCLKGYLYISRVLGKQVTEEASTPSFLSIPLSLASFLK